MYIQLKSRVLKFILWCKICCEKPTLEFFSASFVDFWTSFADFAISFVDFWNSFVDFETVSSTLKSVSSTFQSVSSTFQCFVYFSICFVAFSTSFVDFAEHSAFERLQSLRQLPQVGGHQVSILWSDDFGRKAADKHLPIFDFWTKFYIKNQDESELTDFFCSTLQKREKWPKLQ
jgi:hypothetical protein